MPGYDPDQYPASAWEWVQNTPPGAAADPHDGYYKLKESDDAGQLDAAGKPTHHGFNCTEFLMAKLFPPHLARWGRPDKETVDTHDVEAELRRRGFVEKSSCTRCLAGGEKWACAVLFFAKPAKGEPAPKPREPFHVEVYDPSNGDWVGKGGAASPIIRRKTPSYYPADLTERKNTEVVYFCKKDHALPMPTDLAVYRAATKTAHPTGGKPEWVKGYVPPAPGSGSSGSSGQ